KHQILEMPKWFAKILPMATLSATLFSLNKLQNRNELIAIFVCGLSRFTFILVILSLGFTIGVLQYFNNAYLAPYAKSLQWVWMKSDARHFRDNQKRSLKSSLFSSGKIWYKGSDYFCSYSAFDRTNR